MRILLPNIKTMRTRLELLGYLAKHPDVHAVRVEGLGREVEKLRKDMPKETWRKIHLGPAPGGKFWALSSQMPDYQRQYMPTGSEEARKSKAKTLVAPLEELMKRHKEVYAASGEGFSSWKPGYWKKVASAQELETPWQGVGWYFVVYPTVGLSRREYV